MVSDPYCISIVYLSVGMSFDRVFSISRTVCISDCSGSLDDLAKIFKDFGLHHCNGGWMFRDWIPNATYVSLVGDFNGWKETATPLRKDEKTADIWSCFIGSPLNAAMTKGSQYRLHVVPAEGEPKEMMPLWAIRYAANTKSQAVNAVVWPTSISRGPSRKDFHDKPLSLKGKKLHLLEFDITLVSQKDEKSSLKFARTILARATHSGYHGVVIVGLFHAGVRATSSLLAATPALKDAGDFAAFLQYAHDRSLAVFLEVPSRAIAGKSYLPSYFFTNQRETVQKFDFGRKEVAQYLLYCLQHLGLVLRFQNREARHITMPKCLPQRQKHYRMTGVGPFFSSSLSCTAALKALG